MKTENEQPNETRPTPPEGEAEMDAGLRAFMAARELWVIEKGYEPREKLKTEIEKAEMVLTA